MNATPKQTKVGSHVLFNGLSEKKYPTKGITANKVIEDSLEKIAIRNHSAAFKSDIVFPVTLYL